MSGFVCGTQFSDMSKVQEIKVKKVNLPKSFNLSKNIYDVINQGSRGICCSVSLTDTIKYWENFKKVNYKLSRDYFWLNRANKKIDGMTIREAMDIAKKNKFITTYGKLQDIDSIKTVLVTQGPVILALPCYEDDTYFWRKIGNLRGGHAVVLVGYNEKGFILKNSWGKSYGNGGYIIFPYEDFKLIREIWTIFN